MRFKPKNEFSRNVLTLVTGTGLAQAIPIAVSPILTRVYSPEDFGVFSLFVAIVGIISVISLASYEHAIMLPKYEKYAISIFLLGLFLLSLTAAITLILILIFKNQILYIFNHEQTTGNWLYFIPITVFFLGLFNLSVMHNNRAKCYKDIAHATVIKSAILSLVQVVAGFTQAGAYGLIIGQVLAQFSANVRLLKNIFYNNGLIGKVSVPRMIAVAKKYNNFPKYTLPHALLGSISASLPVYLFTPFWGHETVGHYSLAISVTLSPMMIIAASTAKVYNQQISEMSNRQNDVYVFTIQVVKSLYKRSIIPFVLFVVFAQEIFGFIFGSEWRTAGIYTQILSPYLFLNTIVSTIAYIVIFKGKQRKAFMISAIHFLALSSALYFIAHNGSAIDALIAMSVINCGVLIYNFSWFIKILRN